MPKNKGKAGKNSHRRRKIENICLYKRELEFKEFGQGMCEYMLC
jgi:hypothetical protein